MKTKLELAKRLLDLIHQQRTTQRALSVACDVSHQTVSHWVHGRAHPRDDVLVRAAWFLNTTPEYIRYGVDAEEETKGGVSKSQFTIVSSESKVPSYGIEILDRRTGRLEGVMDVEKRIEDSHIVKEASWFKKFKVSPIDALAVYASDDSMAEFITKDDIVIFNRAKTNVENGKVYLVNYPNGMHARRIRMTFDGSYMLECINTDKNKYPNEFVASSDVGKLDIRGEFVYRQGG
jgi:transcriptional regulator with XRE-family HTH domain